MMDYVLIIGEYFPKVQVECRGDSSVYANVIWVKGDPLPSQADLDQAYYLGLKNNKIRQLSADTEARISEHGFISNALGSDYLYDSTPIDQSNLLGQVQLSQPTPWMPEGQSVWQATRLPSNLNGGVIGPKEYKLHTPQQIWEVGNAGRAFVTSHLIHFNKLRDYINATALTIEEIEAFTLDTPIPG